MHSIDITQATLNGLMLTLVLSMPAIVVATVVGVAVSLFQALTQIQDQTLSFAVKLICVSAVTAATSAWLSVQLLRYTEQMFSSIGTM